MVSSDSTSMTFTESFRNTRELHNGPQKAVKGRGKVYQRGEWWWCDYSVCGVRRRESFQTKDRQEAIAFLNRKLGKLPTGEALTSTNVRVGDLMDLLLDDYDVRGHAQAYIASLKVKSILKPALGDIKASKLTSAHVQQYIQTRKKEVKTATINRELGMLHRAFTLGYQHDPPVVARVPHFPKLPEDDPRKGFLKPETYRKLLFELPEELRLLFRNRLPRRFTARRSAPDQVVPGRHGSRLHIWMDGKKANRKTEPVAVPIYGDMGKFLQMQPKTSDYVFARGSKPILDFRESWKAGLPTCRCPKPPFSRPSSYGGSESAPGESRRDRNHEYHGSPDQERFRALQHHRPHRHKRTKEAGRMTEEFLAREQEDLAQSTLHEKERVN